MGVPVLPLPRYRGSTSFWIAHTYKLTCCPLIHRYSIQRLSILLNVIMTDLAVAVAETVETLFLALASHILYLESTILHIPLSLRYFEEHQSNDARYIAATVLFYLPLCVYVFVPALEWLLGTEERHRLKNADCPGGQLFLALVPVGIFWLQMIMVSRFFKE